MIKGVRWNFVVLFLATSLWVASSLNFRHRQKRQMKNTFFPLTSRKERYMPPIPIRLPPRSHKGSESTRGRSVGREQSPWIPLHGSTKEEMNNKNVYVPPIQPPIHPPVPPKTTFDIPLTKSIQVSPVRPKIQTTGYVRKNVVKVHATRTTTEYPRQEMLGTLAESTVQTLLNFTPLDEGWRPKNVPTTTTPDSNFGKNLGRKVNKHLNYTGVRFGKNNTVLKTMPPNGREVRLSKNETNFVMKFTPDDIKFSSVEVKTEKIHTPFAVDGPEVQHLTGGFDERRPFFDGFSDHAGHIVQTATDLRNEGNIPYQGHKASMENVLSVNKNPLNAELEDSDENRKEILDVISHTKKRKMRLPGQESFENSPFVVRNKDSDQKDGTFVGKALDSLNMNKQVSNDNRNFFSQPPSVYGVDSEQQIKSNLPYQGHVPKPSVTVNSNSLPIRKQHTFFHTPSGNGELINSKQPNDRKAASNFPFSNSPHYVPTNYSPSVQFPHNKASHSDLALNSFPKNRTTEKDNLPVAKVPLNTGMRDDKRSSTDGSVLVDIMKNNHGPSHPPNKILPSRFPPVVPITPEDIRDNKNDDFSIEDQLSSKPALKEVELKNPPKYLQFHDEDFLKPVIPLSHLDKPSAEGDTPKEVEKQSSDASRNRVDHTKAKLSSSKVEYYENTKSEEKKPLEETSDHTYFQPVFPDAPARKSPDTSRQIFQNYENENSEKHVPQTDRVMENSKPHLNEKVGENYLSTLQKISKDVIITKDSHFSPKDTRWKGAQRGRPEDFPRMVTPPPVITMSYDSTELLQNDQNKKGTPPNRTENYAIQLKPVLVPESSGRPRKPNITISTGMLAGILIAALVFLGFLTGSIVYAFHQWKFGRSRSDRQKKKTRSPGFSPEYLDDNLAAAKLRGTKSVGPRQFFDDRRRRASGRFD